MKEGNLNYIMRVDNVLLFKIWIFFFLVFFGFIVILLWYDIKCVLGFFVIVDVWDYIKIKYK